MRRALPTLIALLVCAGLAALATPPPAEAAPTKMEKRLVTRINDARRAHGLRALRISSTLQAASHRWSRYLRRADSFYHARLRTGTGENIAWGTCSWFRPGRAVRAWLRSPSHRDLLLRPGFRRVGAGWSRGPWRSYRCVEMAVARFR